jgi:hypothetical protein
LIKLEKIIDHKLGLKYEIKINKTFIKELRKQIRNQKNMNELEKITHDKLELKK